MSQDLPLLHRLVFWGVLVINAWAQKPGELFDPPSDRGSTPLGGSGGDRRTRSRVAGRSVWWLTALGPGPFM